MESTKSFGTIRNLDYIKTSFLILWKRTVEYKTQFYASLFEQIVYLTTKFFFIFVLINNFNDVVNWDFGDYFLFFLGIDTIRAFAGVFIWNANLSEDILSGNLNMLLSKPLNPFLKHIFLKLNSIGFFYVLFNMIFVPVVCLIYDIQIYNLLVGLLVGLLIGIFTTLLYFSMYSFSFIQPKLEHVLIRIYDAPLHIIGNYPAPFMEKAFFRNILYIFHFYFIGSLLVPIFRDHLLPNFKFQLVLLMILILILSFLTIINWHYGLKKYEAFG